MNDSSLISIIIPTYNRKELLAKAIASVLAQTYKNWELIIVDDNSTDNTKELVAQFSSTDSRIRYIKNNRSKGPSGARNTGILQAQGDVIAFLDSDDEWFDYHLSDSLHIINNTGVDVCFSLWVERRGGDIRNDFEREEIQLNLKNKMKLFDTYDDAILLNDGLFEHFLNDDDWFYHINTMVVKKNKLTEVGLLNENLFYGEDSEYIVRYFEHAKIALISKPHFIYNQSPDSLYFFCDRSSLSAEEIFNNADLLEKLTVTCINSNEFRLGVRKRVLQSNNLSDKATCLKNIDSAISQKYLTLSILHKLKLSKALRYCYLSLRYEFRLNTLFLMLKLLRPNKLKLDNIQLFLN
ncbi:glycosyltransferase family 2 protein [Paenibacillus sp. CAU 1523]|uniref:Glycosyltransferase family 2 protein n=2 Tax=Paenibacillus arenosi TaxID=2774142 RepID=A0ABR9AWN4_9BACL|nr:glycosyltransferase family 2 protein [Paenibacillus arenosi]